MNNRTPPFSFHEGDDPPTPPTRSVREQAARRQARRRFRERDIKIPPVVNLARRRRHRDNPRGFLRCYFADVFFNPFTTDQKTMIRLFVSILKFGGINAMAAARGDGKSSIIIGLSIWAILYGHVKYLVLIGPNTPDAESSLEDLKQYLEFNPKLADDFPEVVTPVVALEGRPQAARYQTIDGDPSRMVWSKKQIVFPTVEGSESSGSIVTARGVEGKIRGLIRQGRRPDLVVIDDLESTETARSSVEVAHRREVVEKDILALGGIGSPIRVVYLCTIIRRGCLADILTDRKLTPAWRGIRQKFLISEPTNDERWERYMEIRDAERMEDPDSLCRRSHRFYLKNRKSMDVGAKVNNPRRFIVKTQPDGSQCEVSAIQHAMNKICDMGRDNFDCEFQNDPPPDNTIETSGITLNAVCQKLNYLDKGVVPTWVETLTAGLDVGSRVIHWVVMGWRQPMVGAVVDYGTERVYRPAEKLDTPEARKQLEAAIYSALGSWAETVTSHSGGYITDATGSAHPIDLAVVDSGWQPDAVCRFTRTTQGKFRPAKGFGSLTGQSRFRMPRKPGGFHGPYWFLSKPAGSGVWLINHDADHWKNAVHAGFLAGENVAGSISLFGREAVHHKIFGQHINAETWTREFIPGKGFRERFRLTSHANHFLDAAALATLAASIKGFRVIEPRKKQKRKLSEIQREKANSIR